MKKLLRKLQSKRGAALSEYGLLMAFVAIIGALLLSNTGLQTAIAAAITAVTNLFP